MRYYHVFNDPGEKEYWFRYEDRRVGSGVNIDGEPVGPGHVEVRLLKIPVIKKTPKGAWLGWSEDDKKFVNLDWNKRFALPTIEEAQESFIARKKRMVSIYEARIRDGKLAIREMDKIRAKDALNFDLASSEAIIL